MADRIKLVQNDNRPTIVLTITDSLTKLPKDLSNSGTTVQVKFLQEGTDTVLATIPCTKTGGGTDGVVQFNFPGTTLAVEPGNYEGEIEINWVGGDVETVYDRLKFRVRDDV